MPFVNAIFNQIMSSRMYQIERFMEHPIETQNNLFQELIRTIAELRQDLADLQDQNRLLSEESEELRKKVENALPLWRRAWETFVLDSAKIEHPKLIPFGHDDKRVSFLACLIGILAELDIGKEPTRFRHRSRVIGSNTRTSLKQPTNDVERGRFADIVRLRLER